jgi:hypothetical protein
MPVTRMGRGISMMARREVVSAVATRYRDAGRAEKGRLISELVALTGWHRKHAIRALAQAGAKDRARRRVAKPLYDAKVKDALAALWEASDRLCGKRLKVMIPALLPALERHGRLVLDAGERALVLKVSAATIDRLLSGIKIAAGGGKRRRAGFSSAVRRQVPVRTFNDWKDPAPGYCEVDLVAHSGTSVAGTFIQTLTMVDVATGWTECLPLITREGALVAEALHRSQSLFPWLIRGLDFDNDSAFMNDEVVPWCRSRSIEVTRSRAYKKNDQAFVEQKNGAVVRRLVGYGRFEGIEAARTLARLFAAARLHVNFFQPCFKLKEKRREGAKVIKRYHAPATPYERALSHPELGEAIKQRLREMHACLDPITLLAEIRAAQAALGQRVDQRAGATSQRVTTRPAAQETPAGFALGLGKGLEAGEQRPIHRRAYIRRKPAPRRPSMLDAHTATIDSWLEEAPHLSATEIMNKLNESCGGTFSEKQLRTVQRHVKAWRRKTARKLMDSAIPALTPDSSDVGSLEQPSPPIAPPLG